MGTSDPIVPEYDNENIFAKILSGDIPSFKVYEDAYVLAFLDAFPVTEGHTIAIPKLKGYRSLLDFPDYAAANFMRAIPRVSRAVKEATGADGINLISNLQAAAGQEVFHPHIHIIPRKAADGLVKLPPSAPNMIAADVANPMATKIKDFISKPILRKAKYLEVEKITPRSRGINIVMQVIGEPTPVEGRPHIFELLAGDSTGQLLLSLNEETVKQFKPKQRIELRNATVRMIRNRIRVMVDKWGKINLAEDSDVVADTTKPNISEKEYEKV
eukprot:GEMP01050509.1.p1 GENE.GEMP01050509.1~~GEMP01050509.1.p1  ORF type:complete len:272 (+),score=45.61 GEMP01050509.1:47-862(+)